VVAVLEELTSHYQPPAFVRSDNGPEFIAHALKRWSKNSGTTTTYIEPGSTWQNGLAASFNSRFRDEFLDTELVTTVAEPQALADPWRWEYNTQDLRSTASTGPTRPSRGACPWRAESGLGQ
jgi:putative transposase